MIDPDQAFDAVRFGVEVMEAGIPLVMEKALVEVVRDDDKNQFAGSEGAPREIGPHQILTERRPGGAETIDPSGPVHRLGQAPVQRLGEGDHRRLDVGIADHRQQGRCVGGMIVAVVDETVIVHPDRVDDGEIPASRPRQGAIGGEPEHGGFVSHRLGRKRFAYRHRTQHQFPDQKRRRKADEDGDQG